MLIDRIPLSSYRSGMLRRVEDTSPSAVRLLLVTATTAGGWGTAADLIEEVVEPREDVVAVSLHLEGTNLDRVFSARLPLASRGKLDPQYRRLLTWRHRVAQAAFLEEVHLFDVLHVTPHVPVVAIPRTNGACLTTLLDATVVQSRGVLSTNRNTDESNVRERHAPMIAAEKRVFERCDHLFAMSEWAIGSLRDDYGLPASDVSLLPPCVDVSQARVRSHDSAEVTRVCFVGNDWRRKGGDALIRWHRKRTGPPVELHVVSRAAPKWIRWLPDVVLHDTATRRDVLTEILPSMDIFALPTRRDMSPWSVVEALACGLPVVSFSLGGIPELVIHQETGLLAEPADTETFFRQLETLVADATTRARFGRAARLRAEQHFDLRVRIGEFLDRLTAMAPTGRRTR